MRSQALLLRSSHYPLASLFRRLSSPSLRPVSSARPFVPYRRITPPSPAAAKLGLHGASRVAGFRGDGAPVRRFCGVRASQVSDPGSIDSPMMQAMENKIKEQLNADTVTVKDAYGDGRHVSIDVVSSAFEGQSAVNRQRMVYKAIWEELQSTVHAVDQMTTRTPAEAASQNQ